MPRKIIRQIPIVEETYPTSPYFEDSAPAKKYKYARAFMNMENSQEIDVNLLVEPHNLQSNTRVLIQRLKRITFSEAFLNVTKNTTDQLVMYTFLRIAFFRNSLEVSASCREVASIVNCLPMSASRSINRLVSFGLLEVIKNNYHPYMPTEQIKKLVKSSKRYRITMQEMFIKTSAKLLHITDNECNNFALAQPDMSEPGTDFYLLTRNVFVNGHSYVKGDKSDSLYEGEKIPRLNKTAGRVFVTLLKYQMLTSQEISDRVAYKKRAVQYALSRLLGYDMVTQVKIEHQGKRYNKWVARQDVEFSVIEEALGLDLWREIQYERFVNDSKKFAEYIDNDEKRLEENKKRAEEKERRRKNKKPVNEAYKKAERERQRKKAQRRHHRLKDL
jgi:predicted transcriptional regulator